MSDEQASLIYALEESIELLREDNDRYRRSNTLLRRINSDLRRLKNIQAQNDEEFKSMCQMEFPYDNVEIQKIVVDVTGSEGGLPDLQAS